MDRLTMLDTEIADTTAKTVYDAAVDMLGRVPHSYRVMMHSPLVLMTLLPFNAVMQREGAGSILTTKLKEMVVVKTSHVNGCEYWFAHNTSLGQAAGISDEQIEVIGTDDYMESDLFSDREKAAILWAEHVTKNTARSRDDVYETVRAQFSEAEMVELTMMSGLFNFYNRFMDSLGVPLEIQGEVDKIKRSVNLDPARVKQYMQTLIDNWPDEFPTPNPDVT